MRKRKKRKIKVLKLLILALSIIAIIALGSYVYKNIKKKSIFENIEEQKVSIEKYFVYGTVLNVYGKITGIEMDKISKVNFTLIDIDGNEKEYKAVNDVENQIMTIKTSELINDGIYLDDINYGQNFLFLKILYKDGSIKYYSMQNNTNYRDIEYYTITKNKLNKKINVQFNIFKLNRNEISYISIDSKKVKIPKDVYDIAIDPGHGGNDPGAVKGNYKEAEIVMKYGIDLKNALEKLGLKVILTRDGTEDTSKESKFNVYSVYDYDGRVNIVGRSKAKYNFSIHVNSLDTTDINGTEIYAPSNASLDLAQSLADNIVKGVNTTYSTRKKDKVSEGVYVRTFTVDEIEESNKEAKQNGYEAYNKTTSTPYLYMIRETGGIATGAYMDGRNKDYGKNLYYDSNIGVESYLIELGYIIDENDLNNMLNNRSAYIEAITKSVNDFILNK